MLGFTANILFLANFKLSSFISGGISCFLGFFCGVIVFSTPWYPLSPWNFCSLSKFFCCFMSKFISLYGPLFPTITSTISVPFSVVIIWFFNVWFFFFYRVIFFCLLSAYGLYMLFSVLFTMVFQNIKADMFLSSNILYQQNLRKGSTFSINIWIYSQKCTIYGSTA